MKVLVVHSFPGVTADRRIDRLYAAGSTHQFIHTFISLIGQEGSGHRGEPEDLEKVQEPLKNRLEALVTAESVDAVAFHTGWFFIEAIDDVVCAIRQLRMAYTGLLIWVEPDGRAVLSAYPGFDIKLDDIPSLDRIFPLF
jgi:hypothetical protein